MTFWPVLRNPAVFIIIIVHCDYKDDSAVYIWACILYIRPFVTIIIGSMRQNSESKMSNLQYYLERENKEIN